MKQAGIYRITNINNSKIYIGSAQNLSKRKTQHFSNLKHNRHTNKYLQNSYNKHKRGVFIFEVIQYVKNIEDLIFYEQKWIDLTYCYDRRFGYNLCEIADRPFIGRTISEEHKRKLKESNTGENHYAFGGHFTEEHKNSLKEARKSQIMTNNKPVLQYGLDNMFIKEWRTTLELGKLGFDPSGISACCNNNRSKSQGFKWKFKINNEIPLIFKDTFVGKPRTYENTRKKTIIQLDLNNNFIREHESITSAAININGLETSISRCLRGIRASYKEFKWKYKIIEKL